MLRYLSSGESHGKELTAIVEGMPSGLTVTPEDINRDLARRQLGYGRGARMSIEKDRVEINAGVRHGLTLGSPVCLVVRNRDWENWQEVMSPEKHSVFPEQADRIVTHPRPGHADLTGGLKYGHRDLRNILERSSARETAVRVAVGALARRLLEEFGISVVSWVEEIGGARWAAPAGLTGRKIHALFKKAEKSVVRCPDAEATGLMTARIDEARKAGDSLGGIFTVAATGVPPGLGSHVQWDRKLDGNLARALMSVQAIKGVEVGIGFGAGSTPGSGVHDEIFYKAAAKKATDDIDVQSWWPREPRFYRRTNNAGGIEGGMSNGEPVLLKAVMKPIPTLYKPLRSVDIDSKKRFTASIERSDVCAVPAAAVVAEAAVAFELAVAFIEKFSGDSIAETAGNYSRYLDEVGRY